MDEEIRSQREEDENAARDQQTPVRRRRSRLYDPANLPEAANAPEGKESRTQAEMRERRLAFREEPEKREEAPDRSFIPQGPSRIPPKARQMSAAPYGENEPSPVPGQETNRHSLSRETMMKANRQAGAGRETMRIGYEPGRMKEAEIPPLMPEDTRMNTPPDNRKAREYLENRRRHFRIGSMEESSPHGSKALTAAVLAILLLALALCVILLLPEENGLRKMLTGLTGDRTRVSSATASSFTLVSGEEIIVPAEVAFSAQTVPQVTALRMIDEDGNELPSENRPFENAEETVWTLTWKAENSYHGTVRLETKIGEQWVDTHLETEVNIGSLITPVPGAVPADVQTALPDSTESPAGPGLLIEGEPVPETAAPETGPTEILPGDGEGTSGEGQADAGSETPAPASADTDIGSGELKVMSVTPTPKPTPTPTPEPKLEMGPAAPEADPSLITTVVIYNSGKKTKEYARPAKELIHMPLGDDYNLKKVMGVLTFRGSAFRQNAASGNVWNAVGLREEWSVEAGTAFGANQVYYGIGWTGQPAIVKWSEEVRPNLNIYESKKEKKGMKEVIIAGLDGAIRFLDLDNGSLTRNSIKLNYPMRGTPSLHPLGAPYMTVGQFARKMKVKTGKIGLRQYNLYSGKEMSLINGLETKKYKAPNDTGSFETSALIDRSSRTLITTGSNGLLYLIYLNDSFDFNAGVYTQAPSTVVMSAATKGQAKRPAQMAIESSPAMYDRYVFYADMGGILRCVDTNNLTTVWAVQTGDSVESAVALDLNPDGGLDLYTANELNLRKKGTAAVRKYNAQTGEEIWCTEIGVAKDKKSSAVIGFRASPVIGQNSLDELVYYTVTGLNDEGRETLNLPEGTEAALIALGKTDGQIIWVRELTQRTYSSPVAVYAQDGAGWIIQCDGSGEILLLEGLTGREVGSLKVEGTIEGSPAVYHNMMVIGTTGKGTSYVYGIKILSGTDEDEPYQEPSEEAEAAPTAAPEGEKTEPAGEDMSDDEELPEMDPEDAEPDDLEEPDDPEESGGYEGSLDVE